jgi:hypothetical protein
VVAGEQRQRTVLGRARGRREPLRVLLLHEQHGAPDDALGREQVLEDRRRDVVRDVAHHDEARHAVRGCGRGEVELEEVALDDGHARHVAALLAQVGGEAAVLLDGHQVTDATGDAQRQRAGAGADLDRDVVLAQVRVLDDALGEALLDEEVLAEFSSRGETAGEQRLLHPRQLARSGFALGTLAHVLRRAGLVRIAQLPRTVRRGVSHGASVRSRAVGRN